MRFASVDGMVQRALREALAAERKKDEEAFQGGMKVRSDAYFSKKEGAPGYAESKRSYEELRDRYNMYLLERLVPLGIDTFKKGMADYSNSAPGALARAAELHEVTGACGSRTLPEASRTRPVRSCGAAFCAARCFHIQEVPGTRRCGCAQVDNLAETVRLSGEAFAKYLRLPKLDS